MATAPAQNNKRKRTNDKPIARGGKRTKEDLEAAQHDPAQQESSLKAYMFHANKLLHKACKKAKTFELQKLTRKIKSTREPKGEGQKPVDQSVLSDLEAQLVCLKALSIDPIPPHLLRSRIPKLACVREIEFVPSIVSAIPSTPASKWTELDGQSAEAKARNRVLANKAVTDAWDEVVRAIKKRLGQPVEPAQPAPLKTTDKGKSKESTTTTRTNEEGGGGGGEKRLSKRAERAKRAEETKKNLPKRSMEVSAERKALLERALGGDAGERGNEGDTEEEEDDSDDQGPIPGSGDEGEFDDDEIERELAAMNGELSGSEGDWGSDSDDDDDNLGGGGGRGGEASESDSSARPTKRSRVAALSPSPRPVPSSARKAAATKPVTSSAFLPSLAAGYVSYSDSDGEDAKWVKAAERETKKGERKNRRGQRARQAIWEKKYGSAAAHVVKAQGGKPLPVDKLKQNKKAIRAGAESVPKSLKPKKGDAAAAGTSKPEAQQAQEPFNPANAPGGSANPNAQPVAPRQRGYGAATATPGSGTAAGGEKMHPSWEAKRKQAEALKSTQPQGKKITFD